MSKELASALRDTLTSSNVSDPNMEPANLVDVLDDIARAIQFSAKHLGTGDAATPMGALELLAKEVKEGSERVAFTRLLKLLKTAPHNDPDQGA